MTAAVLRFTGEQVGPIFERSGPRQREDIRALRDARLIRDAREEGDSWQSVAILALIKVLDNQQRAALLGALDRRAIAADDREAEQAAAIVRMATGSPEHCGRVAEMLVRMSAANSTTGGF